MSTVNHFSPGRTVVLRMHFGGKIWAAEPHILVQDTPEIIALYIMPGTVWKSPVTFSGERVKPALRANGEFIVKNSIWKDNFSLRLKIPGADYSVHLYFDMNKVLRAWYINLETPFKRFKTGFEYTDEELDIVLKPDLFSWHWKDEDELAEAVACGLITPERASYLYQEGERVVKWLQSGKSPFNGWEKWKPDPSWEVPILPEGWDKI
jgi:predicted RNA-binding protein associated with RNAse of E/G family